MRTPPRPLRVIEVARDTASAVLLSAVALAVIPCCAVAQDSVLTEGWVSLDAVTEVPAAPSIEIASSSLDRLVLTVTTPGMLSEPVAEGTAEYRRLKFPGYHHSEDVGHPLLPAVRQLIAVPRGCEVEVSVSTGEAVHYEGALVYPVPATVVRYTPEGWEYLVEEFSLDEEAYVRSGYYPSEIASVSDEGSLRGQGVALLAVYPAQYDAAAMDLRVYPSLTVTLEFVGGDGGLSEGTGPFGRIAREVVLNYQGMEGGPRRGSAGPGDVDTCMTVVQCVANQTDFLMVVHDSLFAVPPDTSWAGMLAQHRAGWNGWNVAIVPSAAVVARSQAQEMSDTAIKEFIQAVYDSCVAEHMEDGKLGYVLLVGDAKDASKGGEHYWLPAHQGPPGYFHPPVPTTTDHWYACVDGEDDYADLMIGRLAADHQSELKWQVKKIIAYEEDASSQDSWRDEVLLSCGFAWKGWYPPGQNNPCVLRDSTWFAASVHDAFGLAQELFFDLPASEIHAHEQEGQNCWSQRWEGTRPLNVLAVNEGRHFVELCVHGWHHETHTFTWRDAATHLDNAGKLPFWMSYSCLTGQFDWVPAPGDSFTDCLGEYLMHKGDMNGAVAYFGATELAKRPWMYLGTFMWEAFFGHHLHSLGEAVAYAKLKELSVVGDLIEILMFNLLGDPALNVFLTDVGYGDRPDYVVAPADLGVLPAFASASEAAQLRAVIHNKSNCNPDTLVAVEFALCERDGSGCAAIDTVWVLPAAWDSVTASAWWTAGDEDDAGHRILRVRVDPGSLQDELFEDNNEAEIHFGTYFPSRSGFPRQMGNLVGLSPAVTEIDNDLTNGPEIVATTRDGGKVAVYSCARGDSLWSVTLPDYHVVLSSPVVGDLDYDGSPEGVVCHIHSEPVVRAYRADGSADWCYSVPSLVSGPVLGDFVAGDGYLETAVVCFFGSDLQVLFISCTGDSVRGVGVSGVLPLPSDTWPCCMELSPCAPDLDGDGRADVAASFSGHTSGVPQLTEKCLIAADGDGLWSWHVGIGGTESPWANVRICSPVVGEVVASSAGLEVLVGKETLDCVGTAGNEGTLLWRRHVRGYLSGVALADLNGDDLLEIVAATHGVPGAPDSITGRVYVFESTGAPVDSFDLDYRCTSQPVIADLDGDGDPEILISSSRPCAVPPYQLRDLSHLDILTFTGGALERFLERPLFFWGRLVSTPAVKDTDDDGSLEIWLVDGEGNVHGFECPWSGTASRWSCFQHDERHTGTYETRVSGTLGSPASWWGDYLMTGDVTVARGAELLIQPGCTVRAAPFFTQPGVRSGGPPQVGWGLKVRGRLDVGGDPVRPARLISSQASPGPGDWHGVLLESGSSARISDAFIAHAYVGVSAADSVELEVRGCELTQHDLAGIKCVGNPAGQSAISISGNLITETEIGIQLQSCAASVRDNTMEECSSYGIKVNTDYGSDIRANRIRVPGPSTTFSGIYVDGSQSDLVVAENAIGDSLLGIPNRGIEYRSSGTNDAGMIKDNTIMAGADTKTAGMYFYNGKPKVRANTLAGKTFSAAFHVGTLGLPPRKLPYLGEAVSGNCTACGDTTQGGCNRVVPDIPADWYVWHASLSPDTVRAECNYWYPGPDSSKFYGKVAWRPYLRSDPGGGRGMAEQGGATEQPAQLALLPNSPNPFNPETVFTFALPQAGHVTLGVYDLAGRLVRTLVDGPLSEGWQAVTWDGRGNRGQRVASGVYFCRLEVGTRSLSRKVVVLK